MPWAHEPGQTWAHEKKNQNFNGVWTILKNSKSDMYESSQSSSIHVIQER